MDKVADAIIKKYEALKKDRSVLENHWQEIAERVLPRYSNTFFEHTPQKGEKRTEKMIDATGAKGLERFAAIVEYFVTPRNQTWHKLKHPDPVLMKNRGVQLYYEDLTRRLFNHRYAAKAGYTSTQHESYISLGAFGTGTYFVEAPNKQAEAADTEAKGLRYRSLSIGSIYFDRNFAGVIDKAYRCFKLSARQAAHMFGREELPEVIQKELEKAEGNSGYTGADDEKFEFIHCVSPNMGYDGSKIDDRGKVYLSRYVSKEGTKVVKTGGFNTWPFPVNRYVTAPQEMYGRSPAMLALPAIKTINAEKEIVLKQGQRAVDPVLLAFDDGVIDTFDLTPGAVNPGGVTPDGRKLVQRLDEGIQIGVGMDLMEMERQDINDIFLVSLFQILTDNPQMTATEVLERTREKGALLSPTVGRQQSDALAPLIERELDLMAEQDLIPEPPPELVEAGGVEYDVEYESPLARAQKAEEASGFLRTLEIAGNVAAIKQDPSVLDIFDLDTALPELNWINAGPMRWLNSPEAVAQIRQARSEQAQMQQMIEAAPAAAGVMKAMDGDKAK